MIQSISIIVTVNGKDYKREVEPRLLLSDFLRHELGLTGTHVGCEHGVCGACTILFDGESMRACLIFAVQADGHQITTVEGLATSFSPSACRWGERGGSASSAAVLLGSAWFAMRLLHAWHTDDPRSIFETKSKPNGR
jgi:aerobic-type carbon monoxide dehydrogenase small subunit (CoxS/CutS family)